MEVFVGCIHYVYHRGGGGGGADDFEGGSQFFWKGARGDVETFYNRKWGGCQFFYLILVYNEKATVMVFFF